MNAYNIEHRGPGSMANDNGYERGINRQLRSYKAIEKENTKTTNFFYNAKSKLHVLVHKCSNENTNEQNGNKADRKG